MLPMTAERKLVPFLVTPFNERSPIFSRDGRWLAYVSDESGRDEIYVRSVSQGLVRRSLSPPRAGRTRSGPRMVENCSTATGIA